MAEVIRRRFSRILIEGKKALGEDAEFSQEPPLEALRRLENQIPKTQTSKFVTLPDLIIIDGLVDTARRLNNLKARGFLD